MDALKFAFEILIVGALALPWLAALIWSLWPNSSFTDSPALLGSLKPIPRILSDGQSAIAIAVIIAVGYLIGSGVSRISRNFFDDELWQQKLPIEDEIRHGVFCEECKAAGELKDLSLPDSPTNDHLLGFRKLCDLTGDWKEPAAAKEMFLLQESQLLLSGEDKVERLKQYYDQMTVLRGAALNGLILFAICLFGSAAGWRRQLSRHTILKNLTLLPAAAVVFYGGFSLYKHWSDLRKDIYIDPPLAEFVLVLFGALGIVINLKEKQAKFYLPACIAAGLLTLVSFGGWWWTEIMYDVQVIHSVPELRPESPKIAAGSVSQPLQDP